MPLRSCVSLVPSHLISLTQHALMHRVHHNSLSRPSALGHFTILSLLVQPLGKCSLTGSLLFGLELQRSQEMAFQTRIFGIQERKAVNTGIVIIIVSIALLLQQ